MPLVDHFEGATPVTGTPGMAFDADETTIATVLGNQEVAWDIGSAETVDLIRLSWSYGTMHPGFGAAGPFAIDIAAAPGGPWTEVLSDSDPVATAGVSYPDDFELTYELTSPETSRYWRLRSWTANNNDFFTINGYEDIPDDPDEPPVDPGYEAPGPGGAILEIYVHDEDASRWGVATWATGPATGTEGIWSGAGWQDVTPQGFMAHVLWGSARPDRGILADQDAASWRITTYDPERVLDPGNPDSPWAPQLLPTVPIRISHETSGRVIRTGYIDDLTYEYKAPEYRGDILATGPIAMANRAEVPDDSSLADTLLERVQDAITAAGIAVGGFPMLPTGPAEASAVPLSPRIEGFASVWRHISSAAREALWVAYETSDAKIGLRSWGAPLERGLEITSPMLENMLSTVSEDGTYSSVRVNNADDTLMIERVAAPLPRYGRRTFERTETTEDPEGWADAVLADRAWPGVQYRPGSIRPRTAADVDMLGGIEIMERVQLTHAGVVSVSGRILGGEMWVQHRGGPSGPTWRFRFTIATDGATAIGLTTLVADGTGDTLVDDATLTDYLEAD